MFCRKNNKRKILGIVTLYLLIRLKYWMYKEQEKGNPFLQLLLMLVDFFSN